MTKGWAARWQARGWTLRTGEPVKNADLWRQLLRLCDRHRVAFRWVRGHAGDRENERCDRLAMAAARGGDLGVDAAYEQEARGPQVSG
jgi:ribonuclease HI